jgi:uncharacterized protein (TIGR03086 family)
MTMDVIKLLEAGFEWTGERVAQVRPDQLDLRTPCDKWDVRGLLNHLLGAMDRIADTVEGKPRPPGFDPDALAKIDRIGDDPLAAYRAGVDRALAVWHTEDVLDRSVEMPFGKAPASFAASISMTDAVVHGWDLSRAIGENADIPAELAGPMLEFAKNNIPDEIRGRAFAPPVPITDGSPSDQLVAFLGRQP